MKVLSENGVVGGFLLLAYVASFAIVGLRKARQSRDMMLVGVLTTLVLAVGFLSTEFSGKGLWFMAAGTTVLLHGLDLRFGPRARRYPEPVGVRQAGRRL
jgi:hypothetical protein